MLNRYRPLSELLRGDSLDRRWDEMMAVGPAGNGWFTPPVDVEETDGAYRIQAELPGIKPEEIEVTVSAGVLTLRGERKYERNEETGGYRTVERRYGRFERSFTLPPSTDENALQAHAVDGVLTILIPKPAPGAEARRVQVKAPGGCDEPTPVRTFTPTTPSPASK